MGVTDPKDNSSLVFISLLISWTLGDSIKPACKVKYENAE
jgi:hypothetical protein